MVKGQEVTESSTPAVKGQELTESSTPAVKGQEVTEASAYAVEGQDMTEASAYEVEGQDVTEASAYAVKGEEVKKRVRFEAETENVTETGKSMVRGEEKMTDESVCEVGWDSETKESFSTFTQFSTQEESEQVDKFIEEEERREYFEYSTMIPVGQEPGATSTPNMSRVAKEQLTEDEKLLTITPSATPLGFQRAKKYSHVVEDSPFTPPGASPAFRMAKKKGVLPLSEGSSSITSVTSLISGDFLKKQ